MAGTWHNLSLSRAEETPGPHCDISSPLVAAVLTAQGNTDSPPVLGSASTGLIFTRSQEGTQPGGLTQPGQTEQGIPHHVPSCWFLVGGNWAGGTHLQLGSVQRALRVAVFVLLFCFMYSPYLYHCCYCSLCLLFCYTDLIPTHQFLPVSFHSPLHPSGGRGSRAITWPFCGQLQLNYNRAK